MANSFFLKNFIQIADSQYFGSVNYYNNLFKHTNTIIELFDNYQKMSFRNRCTLIGSNGLIDLSIPIVGGRNKKQLMCEVKIDYSQPWQQQHIKTIKSCYGKSPFFEYFIFDIETLLKCQYNSLVDLNTALLNWTKKIVKLNNTISFSEAYQAKEVLNGIVDNRNLFMPKDFQKQVGIIKYTQVFESKIGFKPNVSILDMLFCEGPAAKNLLKGNR
ncbi:WbqC family protein [Parasediminibacterium paludis]|uniref:WbqC family protein n=1 Tax=Parasediminibacterium paludis TaxID=908966 RepID=A0ABV8Q284_9BACT